ncbi:hypothetical protein CSB62_20875 [Vibrio splendidus]|uniref:Tetratricopeptide repeat protein n=1 Tax=Vibrio lentus TaxID=136468 RepID=A0A4U2FZN9_9VIBR|nr:hypothetical protein [Vibrio lentus]PHN84026.1 hypothetical protein CSB62_20875 [Vibrio splendidus]MCC4783969.1 hypothetical protein [Vibrio lentus]MCC4854268.1 hypothetical protein [Vibrio lentus]OMO26974.1 hypothetical protein BH583_18935 [Vibrio lentus]PME62466.1 hypothetical protein BCV33_03865 [Vibrio lentus]
MNNENVLQDNILHYFGVLEIDRIIIDKCLLAEKRRELIRAGKLKELLTLLFSIKELNECKYKNEIVEALIPNALWHSGEDINPSSLHSRYKSQDAKNISLLFNSYILNTNAMYEQSIVLLKDLEKNHFSELATQYIGVVPKHAISTWILWNCGELLDKESAEQSMIYLRFVEDNESEFDSKSNALLYLAAGVFLLNNSSYSEAIHYLKKSLEQDKSEHWHGRIYSGLALAYARLKDMQESYIYLTMAIDDIKRHFGPMGWQLRIVESMVLHNEIDEALKLNQSVLDSAVKKNEIGYTIWAKAFMLRFFPDAAQNLNIELESLHREAKSYSMRAALKSLTGLD